jgi:putative restriction endonuclease
VKQVRYPPKVVSVAGDPRVRGYFGNTDFDWYSFLAAQRDVDEVNFWQPSGSGRVVHLDPGSPFFFKLKKPHYAIGGFGFFATKTVLPTSVAWETFGFKNGSATLAEMRKRIARYREEPFGPHDDPNIGCLLIQQPVFFSPNDWIEQPKDWGKQTVQGAGYDLTQGEGKRVWDQCLLQSSSALASALVVGPRFGAPVEVRPRLGQGTFRIAVLDAYGRACAVTGEHSLPVLEAAHIRPYTEGGAHDPRNGLLLRSDLHRLFDKGFVTVTPDLAFRVSERLRQLWNNGHTYYGLHGRRVRTPSRIEYQPDRELLEWHASEVFVA